MGAVRPPAFNNFLDDDDIPPPPPIRLRRQLNIQDMINMVDNFNNGNNDFRQLHNIRQYFANINEFHNTINYDNLTERGKLRADDWFNRQNGGKQKRLDKRFRNKSRKSRKSRKSKKRFRKKSRKYKK